MLELVDRCPARVQKGKFPVIVIEGLDATGKRRVPSSHSKEMNQSVVGIDRSWQMKLPTEFR